MRSNFVAKAGWISLTVLSLCALPPLASAQDLTIKSSHTGTFQLGQTNAYYLLRVSNVGSAPISGSVTVTENAPAGLTITSMLGQGWTCTVSFCTRNDALAEGAAYPAIMVVASVAQSAGSSLTNQATVSGGGDTNAANNTASDLTAVAANGYPVAWGTNEYGQSIVPAGLSNVVAIQAGSCCHSLALKSNGTVVGWGNDRRGESTAPAGLSNVVAIAAGINHNLALKSDGTVVAWGDNTLEDSTVPAGLSNVVAIAAGLNDSLVLKGDGTVVAWGDDSHGQTAVPAGLSGVVAIAASAMYGLALKSDGTVVSWGLIGKDSGQKTVPGGLSNVVAIAAGYMLSLALKSDGTVVAWGDNSYGEADVPVGLSGVVAITAGEFFSLALKSDGSVVFWGRATSGTSVPAGLSNVTAIAAASTGLHNLALVGATPGIMPLAFNVSGASGSPVVRLNIDGTTYAGIGWAFILDWTAGSSHTIGTTSPVAYGDTMQWVFTDWSDGGAITHSIAPTTPTTYQASFKMQYLLATVASPSIGGAISPPTGFFDAGSSVQITATPNPGYVFSGFSGGPTGTTNPQNLTITNGGGTTVTANFVPSATGSCTYSINLTGQSFTSAGGAGTIMVTTQNGCIWTATNSLSWVTLTAPASGAGSGTLGFQVPANTDATRSGTFSVAGLSFNVEQVGLGQFNWTAMFPHFASGGGWNTRLILLNAGVFPTIVRLNFFTDSGTPIALPLNLPQTTGTATLLASTLERALAVGATLVIDTASTDPVSQVGWVQVISIVDTVAGYDDYRLGTDNGFREAFLPLQSTSANTILLPFDHTAGYGTGIAVVNTSTVSSTVGVTIRDDSGNLILTTTAQVPIQGHTSFDLADTYPVAAGIRGTIELDGPGSDGIGALGVRYGPNHEIAAVVPVVK
jgi:hypothetical protein